MSLLLNKKFETLSDLFCFLSLTNPKIQNLTINQCAEIIKHDKNLLRALRIKRIIEKYLIGKYKTPNSAA
ncbi:uncharacterized protein ASCRUDRAFT_81970 [Ascoidea rubescens DSM 1968]|uniref:Uncharacterized protein n=1 Tax=Ascoidea rubescens DSM 1968 TaxID=1344418 RepID=A0A1D2VDW1_9ASCO|nr:hypothetical protein ASCRUDRAFT_81970 [Ascoidea rubescens DSM 1968]ODV59700.1 hypothetical protein ASCRUDRAFT_81970 [Ascoidea rubescens DSM 1968]